MTTIDEAITCGTGAPNCSYLNWVIAARDLDVLYLIGRGRGRGHGGSAAVATAWLDGVYSEFNAAVIIAGGRYPDRGPWLVDPP